MENIWPIDFIWWISAVEIPAFAGLFWLIWRSRQDTDLALRHHRQVIDQASAAARESLSAYKLEVAKSYVSMAYLKDVERRLTAHLLRIEGKINSPPN